MLNEATYAKGQQSTRHHHQYSARREKEEKEERRGEMEGEEKRREKRERGMYQFYQKITSCHVTLINVFLEYSRTSRSKDFLKPCLSNSS